MATYYVIKRIINDYRVEVDANTPAEALRKAYENDHKTGRKTSDYNDGDTFYPSEWIVEDENMKEIEVSLDERSDMLGCD